VLADRLELLRFCDQLPTLISDTTKDLPNLSSTDVMVSAPGEFVPASRFTTFVVRVMKSLRSSSQQDWDHAPPTCSFAEEGISPSRGLRLPDRPLRHGWPVQAIGRNDRQLSLAAGIYRCVRRHLWHTVVHDHQACFVAAAKHLWWPLLGSTTTAFCPVALAFLRWRMWWEGVSVASALLAAPRSAPLGVVTWLAVAAPVGARNWSFAVDAWLLAEVGGRDMLASFYALLEQAHCDREADEVIWNRVSAHRDVRTSWVCAGRGVRHDAVQLFIETDVCRGHVECEKGRAHAAWHRAQLARIAH
jgi:hypothetical protein